MRARSASRRPAPGPTLAVTLTLAVALAAGLAACASGSVPTATSSARPSPAGATILRVYAAASLGKVLAAVAREYESVAPGVTLRVSTDSSSALATKIEQGAPADLFLSADTANPERLRDGGFTDGAIVTFAGNALAVVVPVDDPAGIAAPADLARPGVRIVACATGVPIEAYTARWLERVSGLPAYGPDYPARYAANVVSREENVSAIVAKIGLGEGDAGVVYVTDARAADGVRTIEIPADENVLAHYGGVVLAGAAQPGAAADFLAWLAGPDGEALLAGFGFLPGDPAGS